MSNYIVGLTGGIGSGKTAVSDAFAALGVSVVDADIVAREVVEPGSPALERIVERFGPGILCDGALDRARLRALVFAEPHHKQWLEELLHPLIGERTRQQLAEAPGPYVILASPLLIEAGSQALCHRILVVDVPEAVQVQRTVARDTDDEAQVRRIIASQASREQRLAAADDVIDNSDPLHTLSEKVEALHYMYLALSQEAMP